MRITKCDICEKEISDKSESLYIGIKGKVYDTFEICGNCGKPIIKLLKTKKLLKEDISSKK